jgi:hypothetical protein
MPARGRATGATTARMARRLAWIRPMARTLASEAAAIGLLSRSDLAA